MADREQEASMMSNRSLIKRFLGGVRDRRAQSRPASANGLRVMVVDDSPTIRAVLGKMLGQDSCTVLKAEDGESALSMALVELPDLIFLDVVLPGMHGFAVLRALRHDTRTHSIPIIMMSGNQQATEQFYVRRFGADDFMKKPFGRGDVFARMARLKDTGRLLARGPEYGPVERPAQVEPATSTRGRLPVARVGAGH